MASIIKVDTIKDTGSNDIITSDGAGNVNITATAFNGDGSGLTGISSGAGSVEAWANFNGTGTLSIRASGNVTSITDNGTGNYTVNFTTAMSDANYSVVGTCLGGSSSGSNYMIFGGKNANTSNTQTTSAVTITIAYVSSVSGGGGLLDHDVINVAIFR